MALNKLSAEDAKSMLDSYLRVYYSLTADDVEVSNARGWWRMKELCGEDCHHPIHGCLGCGDRMHHTIAYKPNGRDAKGRFMSCYRVWDALAKERHL